MRLLVLFFIGLLSLQLSAQNGIDSLRLEIEKTKIPAEKRELRLNIGSEFYEMGMYDSALVEYQAALKLTPNSDKENKGKSLRAIARTFHMKEDLESAVYYYNQALRLFQQLPDKPELQADILRDLGRTYYENAQYDSAMNYYMDAKDIYEKHNLQTEGHGVIFHYIGSVFKRQGNMDKACEYYQMQIDFGTKNNMPKIVAEGMYLSTLCLGTDEEMLRNDLKVLAIYQELGEERMSAMMYHNVALGYQSMDMLDSAYYYFNLSIAYERKTGAKSSLALGLSNLATLLLEMKKFGEAKSLLIEAESLANQTQVKKFLQLSMIYEAYYKMYYEQGNYKDAVDYLLLKYTYADSAMDQEHQDAIQEMEIAYQTEKNEAEIAKLELSNKQEQYDRELAEAESARQAANTKIFLIGGLLMMILMIFAVFKWRESKKQQAIISEQKYKVEQQKDLIEEKNKDITDSMIYASSIQQAIITSEEYISNMFRDFFVYYKPRDIVSGDFYWAHQTADGKKLIAVGDCTGHGVPGAMMSMLGSAFLNEIVIEGKEIEPGKILDKMRSQIKNSMGKKGSKDGMDMAFCSIEGNELKFAGANLPIYIVRNDEFIEVKGDKQPVGYQPWPETPFITHEVELKSEDKIYLFSDGYADQFGGPKGKKYKYKTFKDKLAVIAGMTFEEQRLLIDSEFETWKGDLEQLDDVCVLGIRI
jgi:serine phosphatase RsbU (regulator of sigma subunit)